MLLREYQGERHTVTVVAEGYVWREATYASLSIIARAITATSWKARAFLAVCDILEGGEDAFKERARRLRVRLER